MHWALFTLTEAHSRTLVKAVCHIYKGTVTMVLKQRRYLFVSRYVNKSNKTQDGAVIIYKNNVEYACTTHILMHTFCLNELIRAINTQNYPSD